MTFEEWFHKEYEPADLQLKQYAERKEVFIKRGDKYIWLKIMIS